MKQKGETTMKIIKSSMLTEAQINEIEAFIINTKFNNGISFLENDMNYYEDFPCFFMLYDKGLLIAFLSVFIPDSASCEIYFHISDRMHNSLNQIYKIIYSELQPILNEYEIFNSYILFDDQTSLTQSLQQCFYMTFSHSECLMQYNQSYIWANIQSTLKSEITSQNDSLTINTFCGDNYIGSCQAEISGDYALIHDVEINKNFRGLGYGTETLYHTIKHLTKNGYNNILLHVNSANTIAFTMYSHHGFNIKQQIDYWKIDINQATQN